MDQPSIDTIIHVIQVALTPIFLLAAIATLLNVFATRLGRVADRVDVMSTRLETATPEEAGRIAVQLSYLRKRSLVLDGAVVLGTIAGAATCAAAMALYVGTLRDLSAASVLFALFGLALLCTIAALTLFLVEMLMAGNSLRAQALRREKSSGVG
jgi:type IV secretory pathway VirB6-like protein